MKRFAETLLTVLAAPLWLAAFAATAAAVALRDGRPVFFRQERAGLHGKPFAMLKFRTMRPGNGPDMERMTKLGRFLRATSLDELPQLFHVLSGKMALVGPRPLPVRYLPRYSPRQARRHEVRPGITGLAQINGRNAISWEEKFEYDVRYVETRSFALDLRILFATIAKVFRRSGVDSSPQDTMEEFDPRRGA